MSDFKTKMHQIRFLAGALPQTPLGAYSAPPDHLAGFKGPTSKGRGWKGKEKERRTMGGEGKYATVPTGIIFPSRVLVAALS